ncbi:hypothetical protein C8Q74DRAFT_1366036 [Fomes fomentarius]|nr:hypothetical protein C8Q74DRAFT_1366036 [Fomes fomentarius]
MATADASDIGDVISEYAGVKILRDCDIACTALIFYEYCITFDQEFFLFWKRKVNGASILCFLNRYFYLVYAVVDAAHYITMSDRDKVHRDSDPFVLITHRSCSFVLRVDFGLKMFAYLTWADVIVSRTCLMTADTLLNWITWSTIPRRYKVKWVSRRRTFTSVLQQDGTIYFVVLLLMNTLHLVLTMLSYHPAWQNASYVSNFTDPVTAILVSRFLLDLQAAERTSRDLSLFEVDVHLDEVSASSGLVFEQVVGSLASTTMSFGDSENVPHVDIVENSVLLEGIPLEEKRPRNK